MRLALKAALPPKVGPIAKSGWIVVIEHFMKFLRGYNHSLYVFLQKVVGGHFCKIWLGEII